MKRVFVKNMVCDRCKMVVKNEFEKLNLVVGSVFLGEVEVIAGNFMSVRDILDERLRNFGFKLLDDEFEITNNRIKSSLIDYVETSDVLSNRKLSEYISERLNKDYITLSKLFSKMNGITIEKYLIKLKIEKAKQLIQENKLNFSEIAYLLGYSNLSHLSSQFKKNEKVSLTKYKLTNTSNRKSFDKIL